MRDTESNPAGASGPEAAAAAQAKLLRENLELKRRVEELQGALHGPAHAAPPLKMWHPSAITMWAICLGITALLAIAFLAGYLPIQKRQDLLRAEAHQQEQTLPRAETIQVGRSSRDSELDLPGSVQAITEAPILARASGYILRRLADIGDRVHAGQPLAEIEAPELDEQVRQANASLEQAHAALDRALANLEQGKSDMEFARATAERYRRLFERGVISRQDDEQYQTQAQSRLANVEALDKAIAVERGNIRAAEANLARLREMQGYKVVKAPFDGVVTLRNVDAGVLVNAGATLLFRIAQTATLRIYVNVPQQNAGSVRPGQPARLRVSNLPGRDFHGTVARTANALDPTSRTMLAEVHVPNEEGALMPGMYAQVGFSSLRADPPLLIPSDGLITRGAGTLVAVVRPDHTVHLQKVEVGRDYGDRLEVLAGLHQGDTILPNPGDLAREGMEVDPVPQAEKPPAR
jgi:RND family efflux transporter MFP subunit